MKLKILILVMLTGHVACQAQTNKKMEENKNNPLMCDPEKGMCEIQPERENTNHEPLQAETKPVKIVYFTDPICSSCWGIEPQLRKLKLEYGNTIEIEYHMGGLLPDWSYNSGGISKPSDVAHHWDEVSKYYNMPIDGDVWLEDPLNSSYPPSIAFKAAQMQDEAKAELFMRKIREMVFLEKKNITKWEHISRAASLTGLDTIKLKTDYENTAKQLFEADLQLARKIGVRGFPTLFFLNTAGSQQTLYGFKPYTSFADAVVACYPSAVKRTYDTAWQALFNYYPTLTTMEFSELSGRPVRESEMLLQKLTDAGSLKKLTTKNGNLWSVPSDHR